MANIVMGSVNCSKFDCFNQNSFKGIKKWGKIALRVIGIIIILLLISYSSLHHPKVQTYITQSFAESLAEELGAEVTIRGVDVEWVKTVVLEGVLIKDLHKDTLLYIENFALNIVDYSVDSNYYHFGEVELRNAAFHLKQYKGEKDLNLQFIIDHFASEDTANTRWLIDGEVLVFENVNFKYHNENVIDSIASGINFSDLEVLITSGEFRKMHVVGDTIVGRLNNLNLVEKSGFEIKTFSALTEISSVHVSLEELYLETNSSEIKGDIKFRYTDYGDYADFVNKIHIESHLDSTRLNFADIAYFVPSLNGANQEIMVSLSVKGNVNSFIVSDIDIAFEKNTKIKGNLVMSGLPDIHSTFIHFDDVNIQTHYSDLQKIQLPPYNTANYLELPNEVKKLGILTFNGDYRGVISEFELKGELYTALGKIGTNIQYTESKETGFKQYDGRVYAINFDVGKLLETTEIGNVTFDFDVNGIGVNPNDAKANLLGEISSIELLNYVYTDIEIEGDVSNGKFNGYTVVDDENAYLRFDGIVNFTDKIPEFQFIATIQNANLSKLNLASDSCDCIISSFIIADFKGITIDDVEGHIGIYQTQYQQGDKQVEIQDVELFASKDSIARTLKLVSDMINGELVGDYKTADIYQSLNYLIYQSLPAIFDEEITAPDTVYFEYEFEIANTKAVTDIFIPKFELIEPFKITGKLDSRDSSFYAIATCKELNYSNLSIANFTFESQSKNGVLKVDVTSDRLLVGDSLEILNYEFFTKGVNDLVQFETSFNNQDSSMNYANIDGILLIENATKFNLGLTHSDVSIDGLLWKLKENNSINVDSTSITIKNIQFQNDSQMIIAEGKITENPIDKILLLVDDIRLETFNKFYKGSGLTLSGIANGNAVISNPYHGLIFSTDLNCSELLINGDTLGNGNINARWNIEEQAIKTNGNIGNEFAFTGRYFPKKEDENIDMILTMEKLRLKKFEPFVEGVLSDVKGDLSGVLKIKGTLEKPKVKGVLNLVDAGINVDYLNTYYTLKDEYITIEEDWFGFDIITIEDRHGGIATATGTIVHESYKNMNFDVALFPIFFEALHTTADQNPLYYGDAYVSGVVNISGFAETMKMDINVRTEKGTDLYVPLDGSKEYSQIDYIKFIVKDSSLLAQQEEYKVDLNGMEMTFDLEVTPEARMQIIFD
ncbi:MAG: translocation/assembly module TamB domain-containing protein, partial [Flavobacteriales bacterium]|nr:translocation/assembly module TamB domain-containing protein [Flavobacteriales bacterium]